MDMTVNSQLELFLHSVSLSMIFLKLIIPYVTLQVPGIDLTCLWIHLTFFLKFLNPDTKVQKIHFLAFADFCTIIHIVFQITGSNDFVAAAIESARLRCNVIRSQGTGVLSSLGGLFSSAKTNCVNNCNNNGVCIGGTSYRIPLCFVSWLPDNRIGLKAGKTVYINNNIICTTPYYKNREVYVN